MSKNWYKNVFKDKASNVVTPCDRKQSPLSLWHAKGCEKTCPYHYLWNADAGEGEKRREGIGRDKRGRKKTEEEEQEKGEEERWGGENTGRECVGGRREKVSAPVMGGFRPLMHTAKLESERCTTSRRSDTGADAQHRTAGSGQRTADSLQVHSWISKG